MDSFLNGFGQVCVESKRKKRKDPCGSDERDRSLNPLASLGDAVVNLRSREIQLSM